ncbi:MAG TPA: DNA polymerase III subunit gamma/tau [Chloroflexota bacterium]
MPSLYRKWRSRSFDDLVGQEHVVRTLRNAVKGERLAHAYLFTGPRGTGKTSTARILAKAMNCLNPIDGNPCNVCEMCVAANEGRAMDVIEIDAASNTSVDNVRDLRERVAYAAGQGQFKVYIVDEVHRLSGAAFDAFLKTLEEPPPHVVFVFASTEPQKVPATIMSRCQRFDFRRISSDVMLSRLHYIVGEERIDIADEALGLLVLNANGSLRDALGLLDQVSAHASGPIDAAEVRSALGLADPLIVARMSDAMLSGDVGEGLSELRQFLDAGGDAGQLARQLVDYWRNVLLAVAGAVPADLSLDPALLQSLQKHAAAVTKQQAVNVIRALTDGDFGSKFDIPAELPLEVGYVQAALLFHSEPQSSRRVPLELKASRGGENVSGTATTTTPGDARVPEPEPEIPTNGPVPVQPVEAPEPAMSSPPPALNGSGTDLEAAWESVVANMRAKSPSLQAILRSGYLLRADAGEIVIGFMYEFHRNAFSDAAKRKLLEEVVAEVMGVPYRVTCVRTTKEEIAAVHGAVPEDDGFIQEVSERLREFHAKQLGNGSS